MDPGAIATGAALIKLVKEMADLASAGKKSEALDRVIEIQQQVIGILDANDQLGRENRDLREKLRLSGDFVRREGALWLDGTKDPGPYCTACWDTKRDAIRLNVSTAGAICPACKEGYDLSDETRAKYELPAIGQQTGRFMGMDVNLDRRPRLR